MTEISFSPFATAEPVSHFGHGLFPSLSAKPTPENSTILEFLEENKFIHNEAIDPHVKGFTGTFLADEFRAQLQRALGVESVNPIVNIYEMDNSDFLPNSITYRVEVGVSEAFGVFGWSSPFCSSLYAAYQEAVHALLYAISENKNRGQRPHIVVWQRRSTC
jgi:hypothetical protein